MIRIHIWHRYFGVTAAVFVFILSVTGLLLSRTEQLVLDEHFVTQNWLLGLYQIGHNPVTSYAIQDGLVSHSGENLYLNANLIASGVHDLLGAISLQHDMVIATRERLLLFNSEGELVDEISTFTGLPERPLGLALSTNGAPVLRGTQTHWLGSEDLLEWLPLHTAAPVWSQPVHTPAATFTAITQHDRSQQIHWERVLLDLHSGRLFGAAGQWIMELAAVALIVLSLSGFWLWLKRR